MKVKVARIYVTEGKHVHDKVFRILHDEHKVMGVTLFRGISGFGRSGETHSAGLLDISFDLPVVIEFFDTEDNVQQALNAIADLVPTGNVLLFDAENQ